MGTSEKTTQELIDSAERLEEQGAKVEALSTWEAVLERERDPVFLCQFGLLAMEVGNVKEARDAFLEAAVLDPHLPFAHEYLGIWHENQRELEESLKHFDKSLEIEETPRTYTLRGAVQLQLCLVAEARESFTAALNIDPRYEEAYYNLGITYTHEDLPRAISLLRKAVELDPEYAMAHSELGWALRRLNKNEEAEHHLRRAIELDESDAWAHIYLGNLLWEKRDLSSAEELFKRAIDLWPNSSIPYWCLAIFYEYQDRGDEAEEFYQKALAIDPNDPEANKRFGVYLKDIGEKAKAKKYLERAHALDPEDESINEILVSLV
jgi:tetratricopeptide (TPR) repeat protein